jgi:acyl homoserine lactone synthase
MLRFIYAHDLHKHPILAASMFRDRADQFKSRLGWDVSVDRNGEERDQYDACGPLYVIWENRDGTHGGSMRFLPTTGRTMVNEIFGDLNGGLPIVSPLIWESTRFCLSRTAGSHVAAALTLGGTEIMRNFHVDHIVGVFDARMVRIYRNLKFSPAILGVQGEGRDRICLGLWEYTSKVYEQVAQRAGIPLPLSQHWFACSFDDSAAGRPQSLSA